jgi:hydroxyacylglutathione hydrolase
MKVIRTFVPNSFANYNHLVVCSDTSEAAAVDPFDAEHLYTLAETHGVKITQIWITHEHGDHIREVSKLKDLTNAKVSAPETCKGHVNADHWLAHNERVKIGKSSVTHWLTPGHIQGHGVYFSQDDALCKPFIIAGDTLFNAGIGNVKSGDVNELFESVSSLAKHLSDQTELYSGHDYLVTNLKFVLRYFPECLAARQTLEVTEGQTPEERSIQTLGLEKTYNPFIALEQPWVTGQADFGHLNKKQRFITLRNLRDQW